MLRRHVIKHHVISSMISVVMLNAVLSTTANALTIDNFAVTSESYAWNANMNAIVKSVFGDQYRLADWNDIVGYYNEGNDMTPLLDLLRPTSGWASQWVSRNGNEYFNSYRHYHVDVYYHNTPPSYLSHDNIDNHLIDLGSWYTPSRPILAFTNSSAPVPLPPAMALFCAAFSMLAWTGGRKRKCRNAT